MSQLLPGAPADRAAIGLAPGTWLGKHQILRRLAVGGMAEIYLARATGIEQFEKLVVLKRMLPHYAEDPRFIRRFLDEARLAATFAHPNVAHVYDIGGGDGHYYFTMEYVHGADLAAVVRCAAPIPLGHALTIVAGAAAGLHAAHETRASDGRLLGVVHRDVSPSNVLVGYDGSVKLVDFGIARIAAHATQTGGFLGKVRYASPEHVANAPLDRRSDVYALGVVLFELICGARPFEGDSELAILRAIADGTPPSPRSLRAACSPALETIVLRALARDPAARFETAQALQLALEECARVEGLVLSSVALAGYMRERFGAEVAAWDAAQRAGRTLTEHVMATGAPARSTDALTGGTESLAGAELPKVQDHTTGRPAGQARRTSRRRGMIAAAVVAMLAAIGAWQLRSDAPTLAVAATISSAVRRATDAQRAAQGVVDTSTAASMAASSSPTAAPSSPAAPQAPPASPARTISPTARGRSAAPAHTHASPPRGAPTAHAKTWDPDSPFEP